MSTTTWTLAALLVIAPLLAGCSGGNGSDTLTDVDVGSIDVTATTGGVRGVVVDQAIRPIPGATVEVLGSQKKATTTDDLGTFSVSGLPAGDYLVRATHPLYSTAQQTVTVEAGVAEPPIIKVQLQQTVFAKPYIELTQYKGFIVCAIGTYAVVSEECGEGVGVECTPPLQPPACGRVGGQGNNEIQYDFYVQGPTVRSILVEQVWQPNSEQTGELYTVLATDWSCTPTCGGNELNVTAGPSPLLVRYDYNETTAVKDNITGSTRFSAFTWPNWNYDPAAVNAAVNQEYELYVTVSYILPLPKDYSFVAGSPDPFK